MGEGSRALFRLRVPDSIETERVDVFITESATPEDIGLCVVAVVEEEINEDGGALGLWLAVEEIGLLNDEGAGTIGVVVSVWDTPDDDDAIG